MGGCGKLTSLAVVAALFTIAVYAAGLIVLTRLIGGI